MATQQTGAGYLQAAAQAATTSMVQELQQLLQQQLCAASCKHNQHEQTL